MTDYIQVWEVMNEIITRVRNYDVLTITQRGVTTTTASGTWTAATSQLINVSNVRNIRSITVGGSPINYGEDYTADYTYDDSGTQKCKITLNAAETGAYVITYDYGPDKIQLDTPQERLKISSFPRVAVLPMPSPSRPGGMGNVNETDIYFEIIVYDPSTRKVLEYIDAYRKELIDDQIGFYYLKVVRPHGRGALLQGPGRAFKIFQQNMEFISQFNFEKN